MLENKTVFKEKYVEAFKGLFGKTIEKGSGYEKYKALSLLILSEINRRSVVNLDKQKDKKIYYFSMEFLIGKLLRFYLVNFRVSDVIKEGLKELNISYDEIEKYDNEPGLGNGGLGRLAACFLDSMAVLGIDGNGNGIRYKYGLFEQRIVNGSQEEFPDDWLRKEYPWETRKNEEAVIIKFYGNVDVKNVNGKFLFIHQNYESVLAVPYDIPVLGFGNNNSNYLRLWSAEAVKEIDFNLFNEGDFNKALQRKTSAESISHFLYPNDSNLSGKVLRLKQQYFFVSAGLQSIIKKVKKEYGTLKGLQHRICIHINDTHPTLCIPELMRILMDDEGFDWDEAWEITVNTISYTNHTVLPEALEKWDINMVTGLLPRIYMIISEIHRKFEEEQTKLNLSPESRRKTAILFDNMINMANLAIVGSKSVNGVAKLHSQIIKNDTFKDFNDIFPNKFNNKTNGVSHRRFLLMSNDLLSNHITNWIGDGWINNPELLRELKQFVDNKEFLNELMDIKYKNKIKLAQYIYQTKGISVDRHSIFDIQVKRIHAYKRQLLNILHIMYLYNLYKENPQLNYTPRTYIFAGKAAPGYTFAKKIIELVNKVAQKINADESVNDKLKVIFLENFNVTLAELIYPAADISQQISTAGKEASGTGNMKFMMNGAITLGTYDGANIEIMEKVGKDNIYIFGLTAEEIFEYRKNGLYKSIEMVEESSILKTLTRQLCCNTFSDNPDQFQQIYDSLLLQNDEYFVLKDFEEYKNTHVKIDKAYNDKAKWSKMMLNNIASSGYFSSDRTIKEYWEDIWNKSNS